MLLLSVPPVELASPAAEMWWSMLSRCMADDCVLGVGPQPPPPLLLLPVLSRLLLGMTGSG